MAEQSENTLSAYLGPEFQLRLIWQLLVEPEFAEKVIPSLAVEYFDDSNLKRLFIIILEYFHEYEKVPNLQNQSIHQAIYKYKTPNSIIEEESLFSIIKKIELWNERVLNKDLFYDGEVIQKSTNEFIKQQEYRKLGEFILEKTKTGEIKEKYSIGIIEEKIAKITNIGDEEDYGIEVTEGIEKALRKEFRQTIPTGVDVIDILTGGGLGKGEIGIILSPSGVGKTTLLTKIANTAYEHDYNVLQLVFEDTIEQIQRKHFTIWSGIKLSEIDVKNDEVKTKVYEKIDNLKSKGKLVIKRFSQENTSMLTVRKFIERYQKKRGYKFDIIIIDYLDCLESHKKTPDRNEAELAIVKSFEAMAADFNIPCWSAIQSNRSGFGAEYVEAHQTGGNIKRYQKAHFFMSIAKSQGQQEAGLANIRILKARFAQDGQAFEGCVFDNDSLRIVIHDDRYPGKYRGLKKYDDKDIDILKEKVQRTHTTETDVQIKIMKQIDESVDYDDSNALVDNNPEIIDEHVVTDTFEIEENKPIENVHDIVNEPVSDFMNTEKDYVDNAWNGESEIIKDKTEEIKPEIIHETVKKEPLIIMKKPPIEKISDERLKEIENFSEENNVSEKERHVYDFLMQAHKNQRIIKDD